MAYPEDTNGVIVRTVPRSPAVPPATITTSDWADHEVRLVTLEDHFPLDDLTDVNLSGLSDGDTILYDSAGGIWVAGVPVSGIELADASFATIAAGVSRLVPRYGLTANTSGTAGTAYLQPIYGGTGSFDLIARSDHYHSVGIVTRVGTAASGYLSSGSRALGSVNVTLNADVTYLVTAELYGQLRGADSGPAYYTLTLDIDGDTRTSPGGTDGFWCVQGVPDKIKWEHAVNIAGDGTTKTVSASVAFHSGAGFNVDRTYLKVTLAPNR